MKIAIFISYRCILVLPTYNASHFNTAVSRSQSDIIQHQHRVSIPHHHRRKTQHRNRGRKFNMDNRLSRNVGNPVKLHLTSASSTHSVFNHYVGYDHSSNWLSDCPVERNTSCHCLFTNIICTRENSVPFFRDDGSAHSSLDLQRQNITELRGIAFFPLRVQKINLDFNPISFCDQTAFAGLESCLISITMTGCQLTMLTVGMLKDMRRLLVVSFSQNQIVNIPNRFFQDATQLERLFMWGNQIQELEASALFGLINLRKLDLDGNNISKVTENTFRYVPNLEVISLGYNTINSIHGRTFVSMPKLRVLNLDNNAIKYVFPFAFSGIRLLLSLNLNHNQIDYLHENVFEELDQLKTLYLHANSLKNLWPSTFTGLRSLRKLNLEDNKIAILPNVAFYLCKKLHYVYLDNNNLTSITKCIFHERARIKRLSVVGNPIHCDCAMSWLRDLQKHGVSVWGTCKTSSIGAPFGILDPLVYKVGQCTEETSLCAKSGSR